jgi:hypothetical protein
MLRSSVGGWLTDLKRQKFFASFFQKRRVFSSLVAAKSKPPALLLAPRSP